MIVVVWLCVSFCLLCAVAGLVWVSRISRRVGRLVDDLEVATDRLTQTELRRRRDVGEARREREGLESRLIALDGEISALWERVPDGDTGPPISGLQDVVEAVSCLVRDLEVSASAIAEVREQSAGQLSEIEEAVDALRVEVGGMRVDLLSRRVPATLQH